jgi:type I restriction enzyme M protein
MMIKGNDPEQIKNGSTLSIDEFSGKQFDFMLSNPPYGKSWASEQRYIKDGKDVIDPRFTVRLKDYWSLEEDADAVPRSSDGQLLFLMEMVSKMKSLKQSPHGSRIASVHNGSSLFTGDAGGGESNIRRYIIENDLLSAIIQLPNNLFYNTGITTYIWLLSNNKPLQRRGKVQLIDAGQRFKKLRKNLGAKNCELRPWHIKEIMLAYEHFKPLERKNDDDLASQIFDNADFGHYKVTIERPKRLKAQFTKERIAELRFDKTLKEPMLWAYETYGEKVYTNLKDIEKDMLEWCEQNDIDLNAKKRKALVTLATWKKHKDILKTAEHLLKTIGSDIYSNFNDFQKLVETELRSLSRVEGQKSKLSGSEKNLIYAAVSWYDETADKVIKKTEKLKAEKLNKLLQRLNCTAEQLPDYGYYPSDKNGNPVQTRHALSHEGKALSYENYFTTYETESDLRDYENIPLKENIYDYFLQEVKPHVEEAWIDLEKTKIGYEISFNKYFYQHKPLRDITEVSQDIIDLEKENEGLINDILNM